jgi:hypothetical protein
MNSDNLGIDLTNTSIGQKCAKRGYLLGQDPAFFEAEVTWPIVGRLADNDMIQHCDLQNPGSLGQPASKTTIRFTRRRIPRWVIVLCEARICVRCDGEALVSEPFYQACLIHPLHITAALFHNYS